MQYWSIVPITKHITAVVKRIRRNDGTTVEEARLVNKPYQELSKSFKGWEDPPSEYCEYCDEDKWCPKHHVRYESGREMADGLGCPTCKKAEAYEPCPECGEYPF